VTCHTCRTTCKRFGKHRNGLQRYRCGVCRKTFTEDHAQPLGAMRLSLDKATAILQLMLEGDLPPFSAHGSYDVLILLGF